MAGPKLIRSFERLFKSQSPSLITEENTLHEIARIYPQAYAFLENKYGICVQKSERGLSLKRFVEKHALPSCQILFMEIQLDAKASQVKQLVPKEIQALISLEPDLQILDIRETWELKIQGLKNARALTSELLQIILSEWPKNQPILLYCHFGIRSLDAANYLSEQGFERVYCIKGGVDSWSQEIDPSIPRYTGAYC